MALKNPYNFLDMDDLFPPQSVKQLVVFHLKTNIFPWKMMLGVDVFPIVQ